MFSQDFKPCGNNFQVPYDTICLLSRSQILQDVHKTTISSTQILLTGLGYFLPEMSPFSGKISGLGREQFSLGMPFSSPIEDFWSKVCHYVFFYTPPKISVWPEDYFAFHFLQNLLHKSHTRG